MPSPEGPGGGFRPLGERERFAGGFLRLVTGTFVGPDGFTFERDIVRHPGAAGAVPLEDDRRHVLLVRQYRAAVDAPVLEIPAGKLDVAGEEPAECIARELAEEIGYRARRLTPLCDFLTTPGFSDERCWCFLAEDLVPCPADAKGVEERHMSVERVDLLDLDELIAAGELGDAKTVIGLLLTRDRVLGLPARPGSTTGEPAGA